MRKVAQIMGTAVSLDIPACDNPDVFEAVFKRLGEINERFSPYMPTSEVSHFRENRLKKPSAEFEEILAAVKDWQKRTDGYFSAWSDGIFEPSGYVKGWAIEQAGAIIRKNFGTFCIGIGGDVLAASDTDKKWKIGIQDPHDSTKTLRTISLKKGAVATSGTYARGPHIINPLTKKPADYWSSVTIIGPDIITADILATTFFAMGRQGLEFIKQYGQYEAFAVYPYPGK